MSALLKKIPTLLVFVVAATGCATTPDALRSVRDAEPSPELSAREVVQTQLFALGNNNDQDEGIEIAFRFASPGNRQQTGPLPRFTAMLKTPPYDVMLVHDRVEFAPLVERGDQALQRVALYRGSTVVVYDFFLRRQVVSPYENCWMTEAVTLSGVGEDDSELVL